MKYAIIGSGKIGTALARSFARNQIQVGIANSRGPQTLTSLVKDLGPSVTAQTVTEAGEAEIIFLAVPFRAHGQVAKSGPDWTGKILVDTMNTLDLLPEERRALEGALSSEVVAKAFEGARVVKGFNHLPAAQLGMALANPEQRQAVFLSSNDSDASAAVAVLTSRLGFAPVELGRLDQCGVPLHILDSGPGGLIFQNLAKLV